MRSQYLGQASSSLVESSMQSPGFKVCFPGLKSTNENGLGCICGYAELLSEHIKVGDADFHLVSLSKSLKKPRPEWRAEILRDLKAATCIMPLLFRAICFSEITNKVSGVLNTVAGRMLLLHVRHPPWPGIYLGTFPCKLPLSVKPDTSSLPWTQEIQQTPAQPLYSERWSSGPWLYHQALFDLVQASSIPKTEWRIPTLSLAWWQGIK